MFFVTITEKYVVPPTGRQQRLPFQCCRLNAVASLYCQLIYQLLPVFSPLSPRSPFSPLNPLSPRSPEDKTEKQTENHKDFTAAEIKPGQVTKERNLNHIKFG